MSDTSSTSPPSWTILAWSGESAAELDRLTACLGGHLERYPEHAVDDVARALPPLTPPGRLLGRIVVCRRDRRDALAALADPARLVTGGRQAREGHVAFLFPGLGEQYRAMAWELYRAEEAFRTCVDACADLLAPFLEGDLRHLLGLSGERAAPAAASSAARALDLRRMLRRGEVTGGEPIHETSLAQPATFVIEYALARLWLSWGFVPEAMLGYSIGEYVAACLAGVLSLPDALRLVASRARLIQALPAGAMLALPRPEREIASLLGEGVSLAAVNSDDLCVVAGTPEAIATIEARLLAAGEAAVRLPTTHAFHSALMQPIARDFEAVVASVTLRPPRLRYLSNVTGTWITAAQATDPAYWVAHLCSPVRCHDGLRELWRDPARVFVEVGPGRTLGTLAAHETPSGREYLGVSSLSASYEATADQAALLDAVGRLWLFGVSVDWARVLGKGADDSSELAQALGASLAPAAGDAEASSGGAGSPGTPDARARAGWRARPRLFSEYVAPRTELERELTALWERTLKIEPLGMNDNFFELGGHSLLAISILNQLDKAAPAKLRLSLFFEHPTISGLAEVLGGQRTEAAWPSRPDAAAGGRPMHLSYVLPNGLEIVHQNKAETDHFYEDIFEHRSYVRHLDEWPGGACVFDVGANIGLFSMFVHTVDRRARIYAFEPSAPTFAILKHNIAKVGVRAKLFDIGLSDVERTAELTFYPLSSGMSSVYGKRDEEAAVLRAIVQNRIKSDAEGLAPLTAYSDELLEQRLTSQRLSCRLRTLSSVIREERIDRIDLLKIDVQKSELDVLSGIAPEDWGKIDAIVVEVHDIGGRVGVIESLLLRHGYSVEVVQDELYRDTDIYLIYAKRAATRASVPGEHTDAPGQGFGAPGASHRVNR